MTLILQPRSLRAQTDGSANQQQESGSRMGRQAPDHPSPCFLWLSKPAPRDRVQQHARDHHKITPRDRVQQHMTACRSRVRLRVLDAPAQPAANTHGASTSPPVARGTGKPQPQSYHCPQHASVTSELAGKYEGSYDEHSRAGQLSHFSRARFPRGHTRTPVTARGHHRTVSKRVP